MAEKRTIRKLTDLDHNGQLFLADEVLESIAAIAAQEVKGVRSISGNSRPDLKGRLGGKKAVRVETEKDHTLVVDLALNLTLEAKIPQVSRMVQERVKSTIENMTGLSVREVNIHIAQVSTEQE